MLENVYDTLVEPDANLEMRPALAESWDVTPDQLTWTFHLRRGVTFHDGSPLTADDVVFTYRRIIDEELSNVDKLSAVTDVRATNPSTVVIRLKQPTPNLLTNLGGFKGMAIVQRKNVESGQIATHPIGTGPFAFEGQKSGDSITLKANPNYWGGAPKVSGVIFRFIPEKSTALSALQAGEIDWTDSIPTQRVNQLKDDDSVNLAVTPSNDYWYLALNEARKPWNDVRVRQAIAYAIDRDAIVAATSYGTAAKNQLAIPKGNFWYTDYDRYGYDIEQAKRLLQRGRRVAAEPRHAGHQRVSGDGDRCPDHRRQPCPAWYHGQHPHRRLRHLARRAEQRTLRHADDGLAGQHRPRRLLLRAAPHRRHAATRRSSPTPRSTDCSTPAASRRTRMPAREIYRKAATIIADECSYIYLYNPSVIQAWNKDMSGYEARRDKAIRFRTASISEGGAQ